MKTVTRRAANTPREPRAPASTAKVSEEAKAYRRAVAERDLLGDTRFEDRSKKFPAGSPDEVIRKDNSQLALETFEIVKKKRQPLF